MIFLEYWLSTVQYLFLENSLSDQEDYEMNLKLRKLWNRLTISEKRLSHKIFHTIYKDNNIKKVQKNVI